MIRKIKNIFDNFFFTDLRHYYIIIMMLEVRIVEVSVTRMGFAIVLKPLTRSRVVPIFIGPLETYSISSALDGQESERPLTHDLMKKCSGKPKIRIRESRCQ